MSLSRNILMSFVKQAISAEELQKSVVYIIPSVMRGEEITINRKTVTVEMTSVLLFIDMEPAVNWSHRCKYILVQKDAGKPEITDGQFPPDNKNLQLFYKPENIEDWMLLTGKVFKG